MGPKLGTVWQHYKGGRYLVVAQAVIEANLTPAVVYKDMHAGSCWVRPLAEWDETVTHNGKRVPRFRPEEAVTA